MSVMFTNEPRRILIRGVNWLGDAVMTTPALLRLREKFPAAHITLLTPEKLRELWLNHPAINEIISFATDQNIFAIAKKLRAEKFDLALVLPNSPRSALEVFLARIPQRIGYARSWRNFLLTKNFFPGATVKMRKRSAAEIKTLINLPPEKTQNLKLKIQNFSNHQIYDYLNLAATLGANSEPLAPKLSVMPEEIAAAKSKFGLENEKHTGETPVPLLIIFPRHVPG
jgi:heptosyltransferase-2